MEAQRGGIACPNSQPVSGLVKLEPKTVELQNQWPFSPLTPQESLPILSQLWGLGKEKWASFFFWNDLLPTLVVGKINGDHFRNSQISPICGKLKGRHP